MTATAQDQSSRAFDHQVRVIVCDQCGAPLPAPVDGGSATCRFCGATFQLKARVEVPLKVYRSLGLGEAERLEILRKQDGEAFLPTPGLWQFVSGGGLPHDKQDDAVRAFGVIRAQVAVTPTHEAETSLLFLTLLLADHWSAVRDYERQRATFEATLEVAKMPRLRQNVYGMMARNAARVGNLTAADAWLGPCDPTPDDLDMDTVYRITRAALCTVRGQFEEVLTLLGEQIDQVPIADYQDGYAGTLRANALEHVRGIEPAIQELLRQAKKTSYFHLEAIEMNSRYLKLCPQSLPAARRKLGPWNNRFFVMPLGCTTLFVGVLGVALTDAIIGFDRGEPIMGTGASILTGGLLLVVLPILLFLLWLRLREYRSHPPEPKA